MRTFQGCCCASVIFFLATSGQAQTPVTVELVPWVEDLYYPTDIAQCGDARLFISQQNGIVVIVTDSMTVLPEPFLNIQAQVEFNSEQGMLGLAFDPDYASNGFFYVHYITDDSLGHRSVVSRFSVSGDPNLADPNSEVVLFTWPQWTDQHKGGDLAFAPDGTLFISFGDGSTGGDPLNAAQDLSEPLGDILRIRPENNGTYSIPADNPFAFAAGDTMPEIWASGLRNPFRISIDPVAGDLWIGDVGQGGWEEVDRWPLADASGPNFGWRCKEGPDNYDMSLCDIAANFVSAESAQANGMNGGTWCAMVGGVVVRNGVYPRLNGRYLFTDYCSGQFRSLVPDGGGGWIEEVLLQSGPLGLVCIEQDDAGDVFAISNFQQKLYKVLDPCPMPAPTITQVGDSLICSPALTYAWYLNGSLIPGAVGPTLVPSVSGQYVVVAGSAGGCELASDSLLFIASWITSSVDRSGARLFPNPAHDMVVLQWCEQVSQHISGSIIDATGRTVQLFSGSGGTVTLDLQRVPAGHYLLQLQGSDGRLGRMPLLVR